MATQQSFVNSCPLARSACAGTASAHESPALENSMRRIAT